MFTLSISGCRRECLLASVHCIQELLITFEPEGWPFMSYNLVEFNNIEILKPLKDMRISFTSMYVSIVSLNISNSTDKHKRFWKWQFTKNCRYKILKIYSTNYLLWSPSTTGTHPLSFHWTIITCLMCCIVNNGYFLFQP